MSLLLVAWGISFGSLHKQEPPSLPSELPVAFVAHPLKDLGVVVTLPEGWNIAPTMQIALTIHDQNDEPTYVFIEPESYFYHNPSATHLEDYASSYRARGIDVVVDSSTLTEVDGEPALFQVYRAGDIVNGKLDFTSLAGIYGPSHRYVFRHPVSEKFLIISYEGAGDPDILHQVVRRLHFIRE